MFNKVNDKDKEYNSNNAMRPLFIVIFLVSLAFISIFYVWISGGFGISYKGLKPASERRKPKTSNITSNVPITSNIIESNSNSNEVIIPTSNETSNRQVEPTSNSNSNKVEPTSNPTSNEVVPEKGEALYKIVHKYEQLDGTYTDDEIVNKGTIDSEVMPSIASREGYKNPTAKKVKIKEDGTTVIEYVYELEKYTLTVNDYEYIEEGNVSGEYKYGSKVTLTAKEREHHEFTEWTNGDTSQQITITIKGNTEIGLIYDQTAYVVKYNGNGATVSPESIVVDKGKDIGTLPIPDYANVKTHTDWGNQTSIFNDLNRTFEGWYTELSGGIKVEDGYIPNSDMTLYARYNDPCNGLENESWDTIAANVNNQSDYYPLGCTKDIDLDLDEDGVTDKTVSLMVVNNTTPAECDNDNFSQTACGFVVEFENVELWHSLNDDKNFTGWSTSDLREYLNNDIYNALPTELKTNIAPTKVVAMDYPIAQSSDYDRYYRDPHIYIADDKSVTIDNLYITSLEERGIVATGNDTANELTRNFDYYNLDLPQNAYYKYCLECTQPSKYWVSVIYSKIEGVDEFADIPYARTIPDREYYYAEVTDEYGVVPVFRIGKKYKVTFDSNGGENINELIVNDGSSINSLSIPKKSGATFEGWYTELNGGIKIDENYIPTEDVTLYARYIDGCKNFENDSWDTIVSNIKNKLDYYPVGCTKEVILDNSKEYFVADKFTLRILNNTYDERCDSSNFSQTSCGFILGFDEIVFKTTLRSMSTDISYDGWQLSNIRTYLNDYLYNSLPVKLSENIADTNVYSGYKPATNDNYVTTDKFYLPSVREVFDKTVIVDTLKNVNTRQLDYYEANNINYTSGNDVLVKMFDDEPSKWMLMSSVIERNDLNYQFHIEKNGKIHSGKSTVYDSYICVRGVSPIFRIETKNQEKENYTIIFNSNGRKINEKYKAVEPGEKIGQLPELESLNGEFVGWYTEIDGGIEVDENYIPNSDITIYARYNDPCKNFEATPWENISNNVKEQIDYYPVGCRKQVKLDRKYNDIPPSDYIRGAMDDKTSSFACDGIVDNDFIVRVANNTMTDECRGDNYSESACGFVMEFEDIWSISRMQYTTNGNWVESDIRADLKNLFKYLPKGLKENIIFTHVLSSNHEENIVMHESSDRLYLFSTLELWGDPDTDIVDERYTRQLDYYRLKNVTTTNNIDVLIKKYDGEATRWWTRSGLPGRHYSYSNYDLYSGGIGVVGSDGAVDCSDEWPYHDSIPGVSAAFRLGNNKGYKMQFNTNGGYFEIEDFLVGFGETIPLPDPGTPHKYKFLGWYTELNGGIKITDDYVPTSDMKLYARYEPGCSDFETASWDTIAANVESNQEYYAVGCEKNISLDLDNDGTAEKDFIVRVSNTSTSESCSKFGYSQSSCGFVLEFKDIIEQRPINSTTTNVGGWETSEAREYINTNIYNALPEDLKAVITPTKVVTGPVRSRDKDNIVTADKLFLLADREIYASDFYFNESGFTRQLDYYYVLGANHSNNYTTKLYNDRGADWWGRSSGETSYMVAFSSGLEATWDATEANGISPSFKIGSPKYVVKYDYQSDEVDDYKIINVGSSIGKLPVPKTKLLKSFDGWYTDPNNGEKVTSDYVPSGDITLYARYITGCKDFETASWDTIASNVENDSRYYAVGCEKTISLDLDKDGTAEKDFVIRVSNNENPDDCSSDNYSETACGFVLEFKDIISKKSIYNNIISPVEWDSSDARNYINTDIYNALPDELKPYIIPTRVITSYKSSENETYTNTVDMLYLLSSTEINKTYNSNSDLDLTHTRVIDYYSFDSTEKTKKYNSSKDAWWLRTPLSIQSDYFLIANSTFDLISYNATFESGISPAFRLGTADETYYRVVYNVAGSETVEYYKENEEIKSLSEPYIAQQRFVGWYTGLTDGIKVEEGYVPNSNMTLYARFVDACEDFTNDSWDTIATNIATNPEYYPVGCTKDVSVNTNGNSYTRTVKIVNNTTPEECNGENYSQTACGFVLEFTSSIGTYSFNENGLNAGGWKNSDLRKNMNTILYNALPTDLKNIIIPTKVISGHGYNEEETNFVSDDYLYVASTYEVYGSTYNDTLDSDQTRQFDYYKFMEVTIDNYQAVNKNTSYLLRSAYSTSKSYITSVYSRGSADYVNPASYYSIVPAFRIGTTDKNYYTVVYDSNGGEKIPMEFIEAGSEISNLPETVAPEKEFVGWYTELTGGVKVENGYIPEGNVTLYARYIDICEDFRNDSWDTIVANIEATPDYYPVGCTKSITLKPGYKSASSKVKILNTSTPGECSGDNYSETACGFVLGFADVVGRQKMNQTITSAGGWKNSYLRNWLHINIYNILPDDLRDKIIPTRVISGHNSTSGQSNSKTFDYIYLSSTVELWGSANYDTLTTDQTRQYDYYSQSNVTTSKYSLLQSSYANFLRSPRSNTTNKFNIVYGDGSYNYYDANVELAFIPIFRIGSSEKNYYTVAYETNGGTTVPMDTVEAGGSIATLPVTSYTNKTFDGWYTAKRKGTKVENGFTPTGNTVLYARFLDECTEFDEATWDEIKANVDTRTDYYPLGCTKEVELDLDKDGEAETFKEVRIVNNTTPTSCNGDDYSQTACGFVLEFTDVIDLYTMNSNGSNTGGWPETQLQTHLSTDIYNALPNDLKSVMMYTYTLSGYGTGSSNFESLEKLYLLSTVELYGTAVDDRLSTSYTRQLDYYKNNNVTTSKYTLLVKQYENNNTSWWLRSAKSSTRDRFTSVGSGGWATYSYASSTSNGVSPAFRVGTSPVPYYTVSFNTNGGESVKNIIVKGGETITSLPTIKVPLGKAFDGWYTQLEGGIKVEEGYIPTTDITLYARYIDLCNGFDEASWDTIMTNIDSQMDYYGVGCSKNVDLDFNQDGQVDKTAKVRIANNTYPEECSAGNYSQTACGLVLEFDEVIDEQTMGTTIEGGWPSTTLRQYINNDLYNALPSDLKSIIIPTKVVSGYTGSVSSNYESLDKLYFLSFSEIYNYEMQQIDTVMFNQTRQLDYYSALETTFSNYSAAAKIGGTTTTNYWIRTPYYYDGTECFLAVLSSGDLKPTEVTSVAGVSPAFRIGTTSTSYYTVRYNSNGGSIIPDRLVEQGTMLGSIPVPEAPDGMEFDGWYTLLEGGEKITAGYIPNGDITLYARYIDVCNGFGSDDWTTISTNVNNQLDYYGVGCRKSVELDFNQDGTTDKTVKVRVANNTEPEECSEEGYSQSACGFVLEFDEIIENKEMNEEDTTIGGYPASTLKTYIDSTIYNALPPDLKNAIIDTPTVYGYDADEGEDTENFKVVNKLYVLTFNELFGPLGLDPVEETRQLDYYSSKGLSGENENSWNIPKKKFEDSIGDWWLSTPYNSRYLYIPNDDPLNFGYADSEYGIAPAFRLAGTIRSFD